VGVYLLEVHVLRALAIVVKAVEDGWSVGFIHEVEQESLHEVVLGWPEQNDVILSLVIVPVSQDIEFAVVGFLPFLLVECYRDGQALLLLEGFFVSGDDVVGNVHLGVVVFKGERGVVLGEVVHY
jgi:hypothetical protein